MVERFSINEHTKAKCHVFTLTINLLTIVQPMNRPHDIIKHTNAKIN